MSLRERLRLSARGDIITVVTTFCRITNVRDFFLTCFEDVFLNMKVEGSTQTDDGRTIIYTEGARNAN